MKPNPILAQFEQKLRAEFRQQLTELEALHRQKIARYVELDLSALVLMMHDTLGAGPGRAPGALNDFLAQKLEIADAIISDGKDDAELAHTRHHLAARLGRILGPNGVEEYKDLFPMLQGYWEVDKK